ncbi:MAG: DUF4243 domain-containing protein [Acidimicrobiaceae bacterium]|nr:DUF4243 domain-containing protein [Acidimicrobiaceae bacterium]
MTALDEAYERMAAAGFEFRNGFVNHGPMACEALDALGCDQAIDPWARRFADGDEVVEPRPPAPGHAFDWQAALGDYRRLPDWIGFLGQEIDRDGWQTAVATWVPRLLPGLAVVLFHGAIRAAHAVRAIDTADTEPRRAELARALGYWAARFQPGPAPEGGPGQPVAPATAQAAGAAAYYLAKPNIFNLHGVTSSMALDLLGPHLAEPDRAAGLRQLEVDLAQMHGGADKDRGAADEADFAELAKAAAASRDPHQVKLVEACLRGFSATSEPVFAAAAIRVSRVQR